MAVTAPHREAHSELSRRAALAVGAAVAVTVVAWASAFVAIRQVGTAFEPGSLALGRLLTGSVALGIAVLAARAHWVAPSRRSWVGIAVCGVAWFGGYNIALNAAEQRVDAGTAAMLVNIGPILIALLAGVVLREGFPRSLVVGAAVAFAGAVVIGFATGRETDADLLGAVLCLVAALAWAVGVISQKPALREVPALQLTFLACAVGTVVCLPFAGQLWHDIATASPAAIGGVVYLGVVPTAIAFVTWAYALSRMSAGRLGVTTYLVPPLAVGMAWPLLGEVPPALALLGGLLALAGIALSRRR